MPQSKMPQPKNKVPKRLTDKRIAEAIHRTSGIVSAAALQLGCDRKTVYRRILKSERLQEAMQEATERTIDLAEGKLKQQISNGNMTAIIFYLKTKGKHYGYTERQEITGADGEAIRVASKLDTMSDEDLRRIAERG